MQANSPAILPNLLPFTIGPHVLGFLPDKVYLVGMPHMLSVEFEGTAGVRPVAEDVASKDFRNPSSLGKAPPLTGVIYPDLWHGISLTYEATAGGIAKSTYILEPYADAGQIRLQYNLPLELMTDGSLQFTPLWEPEEAASYFSESAPIAWQEIEGQRVPVEVSFRRLENREPILGEAKGLPIFNPNPQVGFHLGHYNPAYPLVIDPTYQWHTFMGGNVWYDWGEGIAVDGNGSVYVTGGSGDFNGPGGQPPLNAYAGNKDIVVLKLDNSGAYQWHTFMGGSEEDWGFGTVLDGKVGGDVTGGRVELSDRDRCPVRWDRVGGRLQGAIGPF